MPGTPQTPGTPQAPGIPQAPGAVVAFAGTIERFGRGAEPLTPGDASFRTTTAEAPPAIANPFALTYSLGEIQQLAPSEGFVAAAGGLGAEDQGFVPAAGGLVADDQGCSGPVNRGAGGAGCGRVVLEESYWTTNAEPAP